MDTTKDPVCGMDVSPETKNRLTYADKEYLFCSTNCLNKFQAQPEQYTDLGSSSNQSSTSEISSSVIYTCPMHPEIEQPTQGSCPKCGMALEPRNVAITETEENPELLDMTRRFWFSVVLGLPVFIIAMLAVVT